jgi:hydroxymethylbilane synthase
MSGAQTIRVGTRASTLARTQTLWVVEQLRHLGHEVTVETIATVGDARGDVPISRIGGDGVFVRELEAALLDGRIDAAVHSLKDLPTAETPGLSLACVPRRATPFDVIVGREHGSIDALPKGAVVGTSSIRRMAQVMFLRQDLRIVGIRGNVDTRLKKLDAGEYDCLVLAGAGLERLGLAGRITEVLRPDAFWPAIAQGALVVQIRANDIAIREAIMPLDDPDTHEAVVAERSCLAALAGGCLAPVGGWARRTAEGRLELGACVLEVAGHHVHRVTSAAAQTSGDEPPETLGRTVAQNLLEQGGDAMLERMRAAAQSNG